MASWDEKSKALVDIRWEENHFRFNHELSGWEERKHSVKKKSNEFKNIIRPKLMLPKPNKIRKIKYFPVISTPPPIPKQNKWKTEEKIESVIMKLLWKLMHKKHIYASFNF